MLEHTGRSIVHKVTNDFAQAVKDMAALSSGKDRSVKITCQDTHLRGNPAYMNFFDVALTSAFGHDLDHATIGPSDAAIDSRASPYCYSSTYLVCEAHEGFVLLKALNRFRHPHQAQSIDDLPPPAA